MDHSVKYSNIIIHKWGLSCFSPRVTLPSVWVNKGDVTFKMGQEM